MSLQLRTAFEIPPETRRVALAAFPHGTLCLQLAEHVAVIAPDWLQTFAPPEWYARYGRRIENYHLPKSDEARQTLAATMGADGQSLLKAIDAPPEQGWLGKVPAVQTLRRVWAEQYLETDGVLSGRPVDDLPSPATLIASPYDPEAHYSTKRGVKWVGYKVQLTETCDPAMPHLIVNVETTPATTPDDNMVAVIHPSLAKRHLLPSEHLVDKGYTSAQVLLDSQQRDHVLIVGPVTDDPSWQARAGIESTHEQAIRRCGLRQCRYRGQAKTHLQHLVTAVAINLIRVTEWLAGTPTAPTRCSRFAALQGAG